MLQQQQPGTAISEGEQFQIDTHTEFPYFDGSSDCELPSKCLHGIFDNQNLSFNFKKLEQYYQSKISPDELDERHFINRDGRNLTPFKLSPYARTNQIQKQVTSHPGNESPFMAKQAGTDLARDGCLEPPQKRHL